MKSTKRMLALVAAACCCAAASGCSPKPYMATVVAVYEEDVDANDGAVQRAWRTTVHLRETGGRLILAGQYGVTGDVFTAYYDSVRQMWTPGR